MNIVKGIKSVDFKILAKGYGVVNWNGPTTLKGDKGRDIDNHSMPKLRGYTNLSGKIKEDSDFKYKKEAEDIDFKKTPLYISQNCIRHHLFREHAYDLHFATNKNLDKILASFTGLVRGYVVPSSQCKRTSALLMEDFVDHLGNGNFEQMGRSGTKEKFVNKHGEESSNTFFSKTTFGETSYSSYGSISMEQLSFISLDQKFDRAAMAIRDDQVEPLISSIQNYIQSLMPILYETPNHLEPKVIFHENYVRIGTIFDEGEHGILLNNDAIQVLVDYTLLKIANLSIRQAKAYMYVDEILVDYNDSHKMMRIKRDEGSINETPKSDYAVYFQAKEG